jgi:transposase
LRNWDALIRYTESGVLLPDNNAIEQAIRPIAVGSSNYLFAGSARGGHAAATMYSLIGTAKLNGLNPYLWLKDVITRLPSHPINRVAELLPLANYKRA